MGSINRQNFLAELGRLLTFMYEEDRQEALARYNRMFDEVADEQALIQFLVSPTRQAVILARSYDAKERKLQVHAQSRGEDEAQSDPAFISAIEELSVKALAKCGLKAEQRDNDTDRISLFDTAAPASAVNIAVEQGADESVDDVADAVDAFLADFSIKDGALVKKGEEKKSLDYDPDLLPELDDNAEQTSPESAPAAVPVERLHESEVIAEELPEPKKEAKVGLLILYIIIAIPVTLLAIAILLVPTTLFLDLAALLGYAGALLLSAAFTSFPVLANLLLVFGAGIAVLALALLCGWIFIWFIGGAIVGLVRGVFRLGRKWCYKEAKQ